MANNGALILLARILLAVIFILAGFSKLADVAGTAGYFTSLGLPGGSALAVIVGLVELVGGIAVLVGFQTRIAALVLGVFTIGTGLVAHMGWSDMNQMVSFQKNLAIAGGFFLLAAYGAGALSIDARRA